MARAKVFVSYSHKDKFWLNEVEKFLTPFNEVDLWYDGRIRAGQVWATSIFEAIAKADIAILLVTQDFLSSEFILEEELPRLIEIHHQRGTLLWIACKPSTYKNTRLNDVQALSTDPSERPLSKMTEAEQADELVAIAGKIVCAINRLRIPPPGSESASGDVAPSGGGPGAAPGGNAFAEKQPISRERPSGSHAPMSFWQQVVRRHPRSPTRFPSITVTFSVVLTLGAVLAFGIKGGLSPLATGTEQVTAAALATMPPIVVAAQFPATPALSIASAVVSASTRVEATVPKCDPSVLKNSLIRQGWMVWKVTKADGKNVTYLDNTNPSPHTVPFESKCVL